jgi:hypothetical protein
MMSGITCSNKYSVDHCSDILVFPLCMPDHDGKIVMPLAQDLRDWVEGPIFLKPLIAIECPTEDKQQQART